MEDKVVVVTGSSSGIGKVIAVHFASIGYKNLVLVARRKELLDVTAEECKKVGASNVLVISKALDQNGACNAVIQEVVEKMKRIDIVISNHGGGKPSLVRDADVDDFKSVIDQNLTSHFELTKYALPHLEKTKGNILYTSSVAAEVTFRNMASYAIAKAGLNHLARCVALEEAPNGIRVNAINPGVIFVEYSNHLLGKEDTEEGKAAAKEAMKDWQPLGRVGEPIDVARLAAFIVGDDNTFMTGTIVRCDGGVVLSNKTNFFKESRTAE